MAAKPSPGKIPKPLPRIRRFEQLGFGMFVHWGLYSQLGRGEWTQFHHKTPAREYARLFTSFDARGFDADAVASFAHESGVRYIALTTRHHEGFSLYDTRGLSTFDAPHSPARRDLVLEFVEACRRHDIVPFLYHTTLDWRWDSARCSERKFSQYLDYLHDSVEILCRHYGEIGGFWFDGNWSRPQSDWQEDRLYRTIRRYQPEAIIINNTGLQARGQAGHPEIDAVTFEQGLPVVPDRRGWKKYLAGEMCETLNGHWGQAVLDFNYKSPAEIIRNLCACRKVGANYLLNIGPTADGQIPEYERAVLHRIGHWIKIHGNLLHEGRPATATCPGPDFILKFRGHHYYFAHALGRDGSGHVVAGTSGKGPRTIEGLATRIKSATWLDSGQAVPFIQSRDHKLLTLDCQGYPYGIDQVVRIAELK